MNTVGVKVFGTKSKEINQFIIDNHETMSQQEIAKRFDVSEKAINSRLDRLRNSGKVAKYGNDTTNRPRSKKLEAKKELILKLVADGKGLKEISDTTGLNRSTIDRFLKGQKVKKSVVVKAKKSSKMDSINKPIRDGNNFSNHSGQNKAKARTKMANYIIDSGVVGTIPTLPNEEWVIEQMINKAIPTNTFLGVESNPNTFKIMKSNLRKLKGIGLKASTHEGLINEVIFGKHENSYAHLILDYCGNLATVTKELEYVIDNDVLMKDGIMALTFSKPIRGTDSESMKLKKLACINNSDDRCESDRAIEGYLHKISGKNHEVMEFFYYQDTYPMVLVIIKRIK